MEHLAKFFEKITPRHVQNTFGHFWERFWAFLEFCKISRFFETISKTRPSMEHYAKRNLRKKYPKTCSKHVGQFGNEFWAFLEFWKFFKNISKTRPSMEHWAKKFSKKFHQNMLKTCLDFFGNDFGHFWNFGNFLIFENISKTRPSMEHWAKKIFRKKYPKTCSKHVWTLLGTILGVFWILKNFQKRFADSTLHGTLGKINSRKNSPKTCWKHVWTNWERFWAFFEFWNFFKSISKTRPYMEHWAKNNFSKKLHQNTFKARLDNFGNDFGRFWNFAKYLIFWNHFEDSTLHGTLRQRENFSEKVTPKHVQNKFWTILGTILGIFGILQNFWFLKRFWKTRPSMENFLKLYAKRFHWSPTHHGTLGKKIFRKNYPKTCSKHVLGTFGNDFGNLWNFENFLNFIKNFSKTRPSMEHWAKKFFEKSTPKLVQNTFGHFWEQF